MPPPTRAFAIGDFHLGCGDALDSFKQDAEFASVIDHIADEHTTLYLNGDIVDFAQIPPFEVAEQMHLLWTQEVSLEKLDKAFAAHPTYFDALGAFLERGGTLAVMNGNHDFDLAWPAVQERIAARLAPTDPTRLRFTTGYERFHGVHIQHGYHFTPENSPDDPERFIHRWPDDDGDEYLERVWGTDFLLEFFNDLEREYPFAGNVKPHLRLLLQGIKRGWIGVNELVRLARFLRRRGVPWKALVSAAFDDDVAPVEDSAHDAVHHVIDAFDDDAWREAVQVAIHEDPDGVQHLQVALRDLPPDQRLVLRHGTPEPLGADPDEDPADAVDVPAAFKDRRDRRAAHALLGPDVTHVVFGHTHAVVDGEGTDLPYFNPGTWLPRLDLRRPSDHALDDGITLDVLSDPTLYRSDRLAVQMVPSTEGGETDVQLVRFD